MMRHSGFARLQKGLRLNRSRPRVVTRHVALVRCLLRFAYTWVITAYIEVCMGHDLCHHIASGVLMYLSRLIHSTVLRWISSLEPTLITMQKFSPKCKDQKCNASVTPQGIARVLMWFAFMGCVVHILHCLSENCAPLGDALRAQTVLGCNIQRNHR